MREQVTEQELRNAIVRLVREMGIPEQEHTVVFGGVRYVLRFREVTLELIQSNRFNISVETRQSPWRINVFPVLDKGEDERHGVFGQAQARFATETTENLVVFVRPREGERRPHKQFGMGMPRVVVEYRGDFPPFPLQDERAAALYELLKRNGWNLSSGVVKAMAAMAPDVFFHLYNLLGGQFIYEGPQILTGEGALAAYLFPYGHLSFVEGIREFGGQKIHRPIKQIAADMIPPLVHEKPMREFVDNILAERGGVVDAVKNAPAVESEDEHAKRGEEILGKLLRIQGQFTRSRMAHTPAPAEEEWKSVVKEAVEWLLSARKHIPYTSAVVAANIIGYAYPKGAPYFVDLLSHLLPDSALLSAAVKFRGSTRPRVDRKIRRETGEELVKRVGAGVIDIKEAAQTVCRGLGESVVIVLDASGSMDPAVKFLNWFMGVIAKADEKVAGAWDAVIIKDGNIYHTKAEKVGVFPAEGRTPLFPALRYAERLQKRTAIIITDWMHNEDRARVINSGETITEPSLCRPAPHVLSLSFGRAPDMPGEEGVYHDVRMNGQPWEFVLQAIADFAKVIMPRMVSLSIEETPDTISLVITSRPAQ